MRTSCPGLNLFALGTTTNSSLTQLGEELAAQDKIEEFDIEKFVNDINMKVDLETKSQIVSDLTRGIMNTSKATTIVLTTGITALPIDRS